MDISFKPTEKAVLLVKEYVVKGTILNYCIDIPFSQKVGDLMTSESLQRFKSGNSCTIDILILDQDSKVLIHKETTCLFYDNSKIRINLPSDFHTKLQQIFWFSTAVSTCDNKYFKNLDEELIETCNIMVYSSNTPLEGHLIDSIVFKPVKIVSKNSIDSMSNEKKMLVDMASKISDSGLFILKTKTKNNKDLPENEVIYASDWKSVTQFKNQPDVTNCVYYLANPTTKLVYIGEAQQLLNRVEVRKVNSPPPIEAGASQEVWYLSLHPSGQPLFLQAGTHPPLLDKALKPTPLLFSNFVSYPDYFFSESLTDTKNFTC